MGLFNHLLYSRRAKQAPVPAGSGWSKGSRLQRFLGISQEQKGIRTAKRKAYKSQKYKLYNEYRSQRRKRHADFKLRRRKLRRWLEKGKLSESEMYKKAGIKRKFQNDPGDMLEKFDRQVDDADRIAWKAHQRQLQQARAELDKQYSSRRNPNVAAMAQAQLAQQRQASSFTGGRKAA